MEHGIRRAMNVILQGDGSPFGVLEVDSRSAGEFAEHDIAFLQGAANILGMAIEQQRYQRTLKAALDRHQILLKEGNHRIKNSLQLVVSMLHLQAREVKDPALTEHLKEASSRVSTVGRAYERLAYDSDDAQIDLVAYLREVLKDAENEAAACRLQVDATGEIPFAADRAILVALVVNELVLNAAKHAYPDGAGGTIWVGIGHTDKHAVAISIRDEGAGLPADFDPATSRGLGGRLIAALSEQLDAKLTRSSADGQGTSFTLQVPLAADSGASGAG